VLAERKDIDVGAAYIVQRAPDLRVGLAQARHQAGLVSVFGARRIQPVAAHDLVHHSYCAPPGSHGGIATDIRHADDGVRADAALDRTGSLRADELAAVGNGFAAGHEVHGSGKPMQSPATSAQAP